MFRSILLLVFTLSPLVSSSTKLAIASSPGDHAVEFSSKMQSVKFAIAQLDEALQANTYDLANPGDITPHPRWRDSEWVRVKLQYMGAIDHYVRKFRMDVLGNGEYSQSEKKQFDSASLRLQKEIDRRNQDDLRRILAELAAEDGGWIRISRFGKYANYQASLVILHADDDLAFQASVLKAMNTAWADHGDTEGQMYAMVWDRVAAPDDAEDGTPAQRKLQRYGTRIDSRNGCPFPVEELEHLNERRKAVGLQTEEEYLAFYGSPCHWPTK